MNIDEMIIELMKIRLDHGGDTMVYGNKTDYECTGTINDIGVYPNHIISSEMDTPEEKDKLKSESDMIVFIGE